MLLPGCFAAGAADRAATTTVGTLKALRSPVAGSGTRSAGPATPEDSLPASPLSLTTRSQSFSFAGRGVVLGSVIALGLLDQQVLVPLIAALAAGLEVGVPEVGIAISAYSFAAALAGLTIGPLSDARGRRRYLLFAACLMFGSAAAIALTLRYEVFLLARIAAGFGGGTIGALAVAWIADLVPYERRGRIMALLLGGAMGAAVLGQVSAAFAAARFGPRWVYVAIALLAIVALLLLVGLPERRPSGGRPPSLGQSLVRHLEFLRSPPHRAAALAAFCMSGSLIGVSAYASGWLQEVRGFPLEQVGLLYGGLGVTIMAAQAIAGPLADRFGKRRFTLVLSVATAVVTVALPGLPSAPLIPALLLFGCLGVARIAAFAALRTELVPEARRAAFMGFSNVFSQLGIAVAVAAGGIVYPYGFATVCWVMAGLGGLAALLILRIPEPGSRGGIPRAA